MGQKSSKRQSYTPGGTQDAGLPSACAAENGDVNSSGSNGQVRLISSKEAEPGDVNSEVHAASSGAVPASSSSLTEGKKKQKKTPRFVLSRKRSGSGKRSKKNRKEANGVRPTSYPPALSRSEETNAGPRTTSERDGKAQSMFVEAVCVKAQDIDIPSTSIEAEVKESKTSPTSSRKPSSESTSSASKASKDKKRNGSGKQKSPSKNKDKDAKKKSKKSKEETDKGNKDDGKKQAAQVAAEVVDIFVPAMETTQGQAPSVQDLSAEVSKGEVLTSEDATPAETKKAATEEVATEEVATEEVATEVTLATVTDAAKMLMLSDSTASAEEEEILSEVEPPILTAEELLAEIDQTIQNKEQREYALQEEAQAAVQLQGGSQEEPEKKAEAEAVELAPNQMTSEEQVKQAEHSFHEDILELINISSEATDSTLQEISDKTGELATEGAADVKMDEVGDVSEVLEEVTESYVIVELRSSVESIRPQPVLDTVRQQVEQLVDCTTSRDMSITENGAEQVLDTAHKKAPEQSTGIPEQSTEIPEQSTGIPEQSTDIPEQSTSQNLEDTKITEVSGSVEPTVAAASTTCTPTEAALPSLTSTQLKTQEKEHKAMKKKEEKERARKEKEEKKRQKEEKKLEAKEKKKKEKEKKEQKLREAKEKVRATDSVTIEVTPGEAAQRAAVEEVVTASETLTVQSTSPGALGITEAAVEEVVTASETLTVQSTPPGALGITDLQQLQVEAEKAVLVGHYQEAAEERQPAISTESTEAPVSTKLKDSSEDAQLRTPHEDDTEEQLLGTSVKKIISSIENSMAMETRTYDDSNPPEVPVAPYPDEEDIVMQSLAAVQFSAALTSPDTSHQEDEVGVPFEATTPEHTKSSPFPLEISDSARSSVLRKIELGPRLRTAILRKSSSSSGENEEKWVSLTQPRHVQVSDLSPPPRKPGARRPLEQTRDSMGKYRYSGSFSRTADPIPVLKETQMVQVTASSQTSLPLLARDEISEQKAEVCEAVGGIQNQEVQEEVISVVASSLSHSANESFTSYSSWKSAEARAPASHEGEVRTFLLNDQGRGLVAPEGGPSTEPVSSATEVSVASIRLTGDHTRDPVDMRSWQSQDSAGNTSAASADNVLLQKVAAAVVDQVQKAAQKKASELEQQQTKPPSKQVACPEEDQQDCGRGDHYGSEAREPEDMDRKTGGMVRTTVMCSEELVVVTSAASTYGVNQEKVEEEFQSSVDDSKVTGSSGQTTDTSDAVSQHKASQAAVMTGNHENRVAAIMVQEKYADSPPFADQAERSSTSSSSESVDVRLDKRAESLQEDGEEDISEDSNKAWDQEDCDTAPSHLQQFNKNYYISVIVDNDQYDHNDDNAVSKTGEKDKDTSELTDQPATNQCSEGDASSRNVFTNQQQMSALFSTQKTATSTSSEQLENGGEGRQHEEVEENQQEKSLEVKLMTVQCNGSHEHHLQSGGVGDSIDTFLKLRNALNGDKETLESNNNVSREDSTSSPVKASETTASTME